MQFHLVMYFKTEPQPASGLQALLNFAMQRSDGYPEAIASLQKALTGQYVQDGPYGLESLRVPLHTPFPADLFLEVDGIFSNAGQNATQNLFNPFHTKDGYSTAEAGQPCLAREGQYTLAYLSGSIPFADRTSLPDTEAVQRRDQLRDFLVEVIDGTHPDFAFLFNDDDPGLWHTGDIKEFPPSRPWAYYWSLFAYPQGGQETLPLSLPMRLETTPNGMLIVQPFDFLFHPLEAYGASHEAQFQLKPQRDAASQALEQSGLKRPYEDFI